MTTSVLEPSSSTASQGRVGLRLSRRTVWTAIGLAAVMAMTFALRFANLQEIGQSNLYYTAAIKSMLQSWHNFFYVAAEPGGSVSIDKPPVGLWLEAISAYFLGVNGFAVVLPQLLAGLGSVLLLFHLVRRSFGNAAGLLAALALAITPVAIAVERNNTPDATLIFVLLLAAWAFIKATETRRLRFLLLGAVLVGIGFNIKMLQAFLPLPAFYALYFLGSQQGWRRKLIQLGLASVVLVAVSLSWAVIVDLTPADQRPYVGSSGNNSVLNLMLGYNGLQRLTGANQGGTPSGSAPDGGTQDGAPPNGNMPANGGPSNASGMFGTGTPGLLRLFQSGLAAQASWLLPLALMMLAVMVVSRSWWRPHTELHRGLILWGGWLLTSAAFFSVAGFFHQYYLAMLGAPLAALVALGVMFVWRWQATHPLRAVGVWLAAAAVTLAFQMYAVLMYQSVGWWILVPVVLALIGFVLLLKNVWRGEYMSRLSFVFVVAALLIIPAVWSGFTTAYADTSGALTQAYAGNSGTNSAGLGFQPVSGGMAGQSVNQTVLDYLQSNTQDTKYLLVVQSSGTGAPYVLATGRAVLYAGGFNGGDEVITGDSLATLVANGEVRYVLWGGGGGGPNQGNANSGIASYLQSSCAAVTDTNISASLSANGQSQFDGGRGGQSTLYQCGLTTLSGSN